MALLALCITVLRRINIHLQILVKDFLSHINEIRNADLKFNTFEEFDVSFGKNNI